MTLFDELVQRLNNFSAGEVVMVLAIAGWVIKSIVVSVINVLKEHKEYVKKDFIKEEEWKDIQEGIKTTKADLTNLTEKMTKDMEKLRSEIEEKMKSQDDAESDLNNAIQKVNMFIDEQREGMTKITERVGNIEVQIDLLLKSDAEHIHAYLVDAYNKYVRVEKSIDLITLQNLERVYNKYMEEIRGEGDEFLTKLMRELRNLPTTMEKK